MGSRGHVDCIGCPWEKIEPPKCAGHTAGPSACQQRPDKERFAKPRSQLLTKQQIRRNAVLKKLHEGRCCLLEASELIRGLGDQWAKETAVSICEYTDMIDGIILQVEEGS